MRKARNGTPVIFRLMLVLFALLLVSSYFSSGLYARYTTLSSAIDSARVARFDISTNLTDGGSIINEIDLTDITPGFSKTYDLTVKNNSEVTVFYTFDVVTYGNIPLSFEFSGNGVGNLEAGAEEKHHTFTVSWPLDENDCSYAGEIDTITVILTCSQVN